MIKLAYVTTSALSARYLMAGQLADMRRHGFDVALFCAGGDDLLFVAEREGVAVVPIPFVREMAPLRDLRALFRLIAALRRFRPAIVNFGTPKAALLASIASAFLRVPVRIYTLRGLRSETSRGAKRFVMETLERLTSRLAHRVVCVSESLRETYTARGLARRDKTVVLGNGSSNGIDVARFTRSAAVGLRIRAQLGIDETDVVIGFIGRLTRDKGVADLLAAFEDVVARAPQARLLVIGEAESGDPIDTATLGRLTKHPRMTRVGLVEDVAAHYSALDVLVLPSYREGFPNVPLEAAAASIPVVGYRATGTIDAVEDGVTGTLVPVGDVSALADALERYVRDVDLRRSHGEAGRKRVEAWFAREEIWRCLRELYDDEFRRRG